MLAINMAQLLCCGMCIRDSVWNSNQICVLHWVHIVMCTFCCNPIKACGGSGALHEGVLAG